MINEDEFKELVNTLKNNCDGTNIDDCWYRDCAECLAKALLNANYRKSVNVEEKEDVK